ncbi:MULTISPECIES: hypothetical protein [Streptomyces]|uniref:Uncharacterized protein n=1 Tax=Streptomyces pseudovenezuelae TaxID=67350 RepID=A0A124H9P0_9ACTN|nr:MULTISPECIES: hypothetical protein [Streptomyces]KUM85567.1 hypothetical protein AQI94_27325 [Streptomyces pseudovenezuelae]
MAGSFDAEIKMVYPVDDGTFFTVDRIPSGTPFDVIANVEIGDEINGNVDEHDVWVSVRNLSKSTVVAARHLNETLAPQKDTRRRLEVRVDFDTPWTADNGDVLEVVASYRVRAGINTIFSAARSLPFVIAPED